MSRRSARPARQRSTTRTRRSTRRRAQLGLSTTAIPRRGGGPGRGRFPCLVADLALEDRAVLQLDVAAADLDRAALLELRQDAVHRHARRADESREVLLGEIDLLAARGLGEVEQALRDAPGQVEEHEVLDVARAVADHLHEEREHPAHRVGVAFERRDEVRAREREGVDLGGRRIIKKKRPFVEEREVPEYIAAPLERDDDLAPLLDEDRTLQRSGGT